MNNLRRYGTLQRMDGEGNERKFILSFSSEQPVTRWFGVEILDHSPGAVDLTRLNDIGCLLFNHNRDRVVGKINRAWVEEYRGYAEVEFDTDAESEVIYQKVRSETLKGVSVGYRIDSLEEVLAGKTSADGRFTGPCELRGSGAPSKFPSSRYRLTKRSAWAERRSNPEKSRWPSSKANFKSI